jgi:protein-L-isoaspartate(D-aspartate) O-methyltransferase
MASQKIGVSMGDLARLLSNLKLSGIEIPKEIENAMYRVEIEDFTDYNPEEFYLDRPVVFLKSDDGGIKNISAPHMVVTLLHNLELKKGQHVVIYGAKGGYISALVAHIIEEEGSITLIDPSTEVITHVSRRLIGYPTIKCYHIEQLDENILPPLNRVLVTGQLESLPIWLSDGLEEGGFAIAPIGNRSAQSLIKIEKQGNELFETDLGSVIFGPLDISESIIDSPSPSEMAEMIEHVIEIMSDSDIIKESDKSKLYDLVAELRQLPDDLPPPEELDEPSEHPMIELMMEKGEWFVLLWPIIQASLETRIASFDSPNEQNKNHNHSDFIP